MKARALARTRNRLAIGNEGNGGRLAIGEPTGEDCWPNELKLSDRGWQGQTMHTERAYRQPLFAGARG